MATVRSKKVGSLEGTGGWHRKSVYWVDGVKSKQLKRKKIGGWGSLQLQSAPQISHRGSTASKRRLPQCRKSGQQT